MRMHACTDCVSHACPATIISSPVGKLAVKPHQIGPDYQRRYCGFIAKFHVISRYEKIITIQALMGRYFFTGGGEPYVILMVMPLSEVYISGWDSFSPGLVFKGQTFFIGRKHTGHRWWTGGGCCCKHHPVILLLKILPAVLLLQWSNDTSIYLLTYKIIYKTLNQTTVNRGWSTDFGQKFMKSFYSESFAPKTPNLPDVSILKPLCPRHWQTSKFAFLRVKSNMAVVCHVGRTRYVHGRFALVPIIRRPISAYEKLL